MESAVSPNIGNSGKVSAADALWSLIAGQPKSTRRALTERLLSEDIELAEQHPPCFDRKTIVRRYRIGRTTGAESKY